MRYRAQEVSSRIPLNDLARHTAALADPLREALERVLRRGWLVLGPEVAAFEREFAAYCGARECIGVGNGTDALELALRALGCGPGTDVMTVANAGMYTTAAALALGARPVFVDIDREALTMCPRSLEERLTAGAKAIVVTHLYGRLADMDALLAVARRRGVPVVEDCAQAHGATRDGRRAGAFGELACFSFYPTKNLGALGDGGALVTSNTALAETLRKLRQYGWSEKYHATIPGGRNSRLDEIQAAILRVKLPHLDGWNAKRRAIVARYREAAMDMPLRFSPFAGGDDVAHLCVVRAEGRERLAQRLAAEGIDTAIHYPIPDHEQPVVRQLGRPAPALPVTDQTQHEILTLPCFPEMTGQEVERVCLAIRQ